LQHTAVRITCSDAWSHDHVIFAISHGRPPIRSAFDSDECHVTAFRLISDAAHTTITSDGEVAAADKHSLAADVTQLCE